MTWKTVEKLHIKLQNTASCTDVKKEEQKCLMTLQH